MESKILFSYTQNPCLSLKKERVKMMARLKVRDHVIKFVVVMKRLMLQLW